MKKILIIASTPPPFHGTTYAVKQLLDYDFRGHFKIFHINTRFTNDQETLGRFSFVKIFLLLKYLLQITKTIILNKPEFAIICPTFSSSVFLKDSIITLTVSILMKTKCIFWEHGNGLAEMYDKSNIFYKKFIKFVMNLPIYHVPVTNKLAILNYNFFVNKDKIHSIPNGIYDYIPDKLKQSPKKNDYIKITYLSNMHPTKGWLILLEAAKVLCEKYDNIRFDFYGKPTKDAPIEYILKNFDIIKNKERIKYHGPIYGFDKEKFLYETDIMCFPTYYKKETFGLINLEAMKYCKPIITTAQGGISEIVIDGKSGFLVQKKNVEDLVNKLMILIDNKELRDEMGHFNRKRFEENYTFENHIKKWKQLLSSM